MKTTGVATAVASTGFWTSSAPAQSKAAIEKLNIACIGTGNRAAEDVRGVASEHIIALVDVDQNFLNRQAKNFPQARKYDDYREMLAVEAKNLDAVVVGTTDHHHAPASIRAIREGLHVYCEKPLTHTVEEARIIAEAAAKHKVATQLGTQIHAGDNYRRVVEAIQSGVIGDVIDVHVWVGKGWGGKVERPEGGKEVPPHLNWDVWIGPAPYRPYWPGIYHPAQWRRWWDFGGGTLADMACHYMDLPFWALELRHPISCEAEGGPVHPETCPHGLKIKYQFPARGSLPALTLTWYDGDSIPKKVDGQQVPGSGVMFIGTEGKLFADYGSHKLFPVEKFKDYTPPPQTIEKSIGHHAEWIRACKEGTPTTCNFDYSGALTEAVLLGNVAYRTGKRLEWDANTLTATNAPEADRFIRKEYREGWEVRAAKPIAAG